MLRVGLSVPGQVYAAHVDDLVAGYLSSDLYVKGSLLSYALDTRGEVVDSVLLKTTVGKPKSFMAEPKRNIENDPFSSKRK